MHFYQSLCEELKTPSQMIMSFLLLAPNKYKVYTIPKRRSGKRIIAHPSKELKKYQRATNKILKGVLPIHDAAFAYKRKSSIKKNAMQHQKSQYLLKMDFQNFFHSITPDTFFSALEKLNISLGERDAYALKQILFWNPSKTQGRKLILSIGAPSSPMISNFIMYFFDDALQTYCERRKITYTRYADDLTFSTNQKNLLFEVPEVVKKLLIDHVDGYVSINESKTIFSSKAHNRHVTGITLTNDNKLSIGRSRKRYISSLIHQYKLGTLSGEDTDHLRGLFAFASDIEPCFKGRMIRKYSLKTINQLTMVSK